MVQPTGPLHCCDYVALRWTYDNPSSWAISDTVNVELWLHHTFTPNSKIGTIVSDLPCNIGGNAGFNWRVPATLPWTVAASDDVYVRLYKTTDPSENSEHLWTKPATFNIVGCPSTSVCPTASPTPAPTPFPTPLPPTPLPTDSTSATPTNRTTTATNTTTTTATGSTSSGGSSSGGTSSPMESTQSGSMSGSGGNSSSASWTTLVVDPNSQSSATGNATVLLDACLRWSDCVACHQQTQCYWCGDDSADFFGCRSIGLGGGFLGPSDAATHIVPNLFANDGSTCQNWYYGQCAITGRALVFLVAGAIALVLVSGCVSLIVYCCCCRGKCCKGGASSKSDHDHVPLLSSMDDDMPSRPVVDDDDSGVPKSLA